MGTTFAQGGAPEGVEYVDQEEEYVVDPATGEGRWVAVGTSNVPLAPPPPPGVRRAFLIEVQMHFDVHVIVCCLTS